MSDGFEFALHSPLTKEDWNKISDAEHENTISVTFQTPQGRQVKYIKCEVLDKIRAEIYLKQYDFMSDKDYDEGIRFGLMLAYQIIDKYKAEGSGKE